MTTPTRARTTDQNSDQQDSEWHRRREAGSLVGLKSLWLIYRLLGRRALSFALYPIVAYFYLVRGDARRASHEFLCQHHVYFKDEWDHKPGWRDGLRHFYEFSESVVDKLLAWKESVLAEDFTLLDPAVVRRTEQETRGLLIIGSHHGNIEYCREFLQGSLSHVVNLLVYDRHAGNFVRLMREFSDDSRINVYQVDEFSVATMLLLREKIQRGEWVFVAGDRIPLSGAERTVEASFLGRSARFPIGPYLLARALQCPVRLMFSWRNHIGNDQRLYFNVVEFAEQVTLPPRIRDEKIRQLAQSYACELEKVVRVAPYQWFNFYPYWSDFDG